MRTLIPFLFLFFIRIVPVQAQILIRNTNVLDVERQQLLAAFDVLITGDRITSLGKTGSLKTPANTTVLDGSGKWLIPGFADAHVHFFQSGGLFTRPDAIDLRKYKPYADEINWVHAHMDELLRLYLSKGITSVIDVGASNHFLQQRDSFSTSPYAPSVKMTGPLLTTWMPPVFKNLGEDAPFVELSSPEQARKSVQDMLPLHPDFIKIWYIPMGATPEAGARAKLSLVQAVIDEAHAHHLRVAVHATELITARLAVESGADYLVHSVSDEVLPADFIQLLKTKKVVLCPTLIVGGNYGKVLSGKYKFSTWELNHAHPFVINSILAYPRPDSIRARSIQQYFESKAAVATQVHEDSVMAVNLTLLTAAGVTIATGTDAGNIGTQHMTSFFDEIKAMQSTGMNTWQLLQSSTINPAKAVGEDSLWGSIRKGKMANLVLLNANPLTELENWKSTAIVINKGVMLDPDTLVRKSPEWLVQQQLNAYNAQDIDAFMEPYAEDAELGNLNGPVEVSGRTQMRDQYSFLKKLPYIYCRILNRIVQGNTVIDEEEVQIGKTKPVIQTGAAIYQIKNGKISRVWFTD